MLTVAFHRQLLEIRRAALEVLVVWQYCDRFSPKETVVPDRDQPHEHRQVALERRVPEMSIQLMETREHGAEIFRSDRDHSGQSDCRVDRVATADPIPEFEHVRGVDAELRHSLTVG